MPRNVINFGNPEFIESFSRVKEERPDWREILAAALRAWERLYTYVRDSDWQSTEILTVLQKQSSHVYHLDIGYQSFTLSLDVKKTSNPETPFLITLLAIGPAED